MPPKTASPTPFPQLKVRGPGGQTFVVELCTERLSIGRVPGWNDVALEPDPECLISRQAHCRVERSDGSWWVVDNQSVNGTFLRRGGRMDPVRARTPLAEGD